MTSHGRYHAFILCLFTSLMKISRPLDLTIDNQLAIVANDCYTRISIGTNLPMSNIFLTSKVATVSDCEEECSKNRISCNAFSFGIDPKGNATCNLGMQIPKFESLITDPDYDVYVRSQRSPHCQLERIFNLQNGIKNIRKNDSTPIKGFGSGLLRPNISPPSRNDAAGNSGNNQQLNYPTYVSSADDDRRISDIVRNHKQRPGSSLQSTYTALAREKNRKLSTTTENRNLYPENRQIFGQRIHYNDHADYTTSFRQLSIEDNRFSTNKPILDHSAESYERNPLEFGRSSSNFDGFSTIGPAFRSHEPDKYLYLVGKYENQKDSFRPSNTFGENGRGENFESQRWGNFDLRQKELKTHGRNNSSTFANVPDVFKQTNNFYKSSNDKENYKLDFANFPRPTTSDYDDIHGGFGDRIQAKYKSCYRRLFSGKKMLDMHIRRAIECQRIEDCHRACDYEKLFVCAGFNYRHMGPGQRGMCELTSMPYPRMDVHRDFATDPQCDYYEKDVNCPAEKYEPRRRPAWSYDYPARHDDLPRPILPGPYKTNWRFSNELPRPLDYNPPRPTPEIERERPPLIYGPPYEPNDSYNQRPYSPARTYPERPYLPRRPEDDRDEDRKYPARPTYEEFYFRNFGRPFPPPPYMDRRTGYEQYPQDIGTNEIGPYYSDHRKDPNRYWGTYGGVYGSSFPHDTNNVGNFDNKNLSHQPGRPVQHHSQRPFENDHFHGEFYNYGGAFGYGDNYAPSYRDFVYGGTGRDQDCSIRAGAGFKLGRAIVAKSYLTPNLDQCESLCVNEKEFPCMTFAYRYNVASTDPTDNCLLSELPYRDLNFYTDLVPDRDYDIYAVIGDTKTCNRNKPTDQPPPDECFWRIRSGFGMPPDVTRKTMIVDGIGECQIQCTTSQSFTCRSFAFRYGQQGSRQDTPANCFLSDWPSQEIDPVNMPDMDGAELYERGSFGRGCEPYPLPPFNSLRVGKNKPLRGDEGCYAGYHRPCKLTSYAVLLSTRAESEADCRAKCTQMRNKDSTPCMSFSFRVTGHERDENCLLSDVPIRDLRPGLDYTYDDQHVLYAWRDLDPRCHVSIYALDDDHVFGAPSYGSGRPLIPGPAYIGPGSGHNSENRPGVTSGRPRPSYGPPYESAGNDYPDKPVGNGYGNRPIGNGYGDRPVGNGYGDRPIDTAYGQRPIDNGYGNGVRPLDPDRPDPIGPSYGLGPPRPEPIGPSYNQERPRPDPIGPSYNQGRPRPGPIGPSYNQERPRPDPIGPSYNPGRPRPDPIGPTYNPERPRPDPIGPTYNQGRPRPDPGPFYGPGGLRPPENGHGLGVRPSDPDKPDPYGPSLGSNGYGYGNGFSVDGYPVYRPNFPYPADELSTFQHYTVNGYPCKRGTRCEKNKIAGFWSCETEGSEFGSWDYCCAPNSRCGYSRGYNYPWCYVGLSEDQWRPCSDKYYPYLPSPRPLRPKPKFRNGDEDDQHFYINSPDFSARHWPVIYVHGEPPPNCTDSIASANNSRGRRLNETATIPAQEKTNNTNAIRQKLRKRRLRARTIVDNRTGIMLFENTTLRYPNERSNNSTETKVEPRQYVRVQTVDSNTELSATNADDDEGHQFFSTSTEFTPKGPRAGKIERIVKPFVTRATNATVLPINERESKLR